MKRVFKFFAAAAILAVAVSCGKDEVPQNSGSQYEEEEKPGSGDSGDSGDDSGDEEYGPQYTYPEEFGTPGDRSTYKTIEFKNYNLGNQVYYGYYADENGEPIKGYANWNIELFDSYDTQGFLCIEINTEDGAETIPAGRYEYKEDEPGDFTDISFVPGALIAGYESEYGAFGSWFFDIDNPIDDEGTYYAYGVTDGFVDVSIDSKGVYTFSYTLYDDIEGYVMKGVSTVEELELIDGTEDYDAETLSTKSQSRAGRRHCTVKKLSAIKSR